jgi:Mrp family chromosome partitioning ATPase
MSVLVVGSTKGGSGKSTLATNIAVARAKAGKKVLLIDADTRKPQLSLLRLERSN